jgi:hypothetical protein
MSISEQVYGLCLNPHSVSQALAEDASITPGQAAKKLYHPDSISISEGHVPLQRVPASEEELERAFQCGKFNSRPSQLFLRVFHDSLMPLQHDPLMGCCSPSLLGSSGVCPLTVIGPLPDICRHMVGKSFLSPLHTWTDQVLSPTLLQEQRRRSCLQQTIGWTLMLLDSSLMAFWSFRDVQEPEENVQLSRSCTIEETSSR